MKYQPASIVGEHGLSDKDLQREIAKDVAHAKYYENGRITPGTLVTITLGMIAIVLAATQQGQWRYSITAAGISWGFAIGRAVDLIIRKRLRHGAAYKAYCHGLALHRLTDNNLPECDIQPLAKAA